MAQKDNNQINQDYVDWQTSVRLSDYGNNGDGRNTAHESAPCSANSLNELLSTDGRSFIILAFRTFLNRDPSESEFKQFKSDLDSGISKSILAARLRYTKEAKSRPQKFKLQKALWIDRFSSIPIFGWAINFAVSMLSLSGIKKTVLAQSQAISQMRVELDGLSHHLQQMNSAIIRDIVTAEERHKLDINQTTSNLDALARELRQESRSLRDRQLEIDELIKTLKPSESNERIGSQETLIDDDFYIAFESHFRGSEKTIKNRLSYYLPLLDKKLSPLLKNEPCVDIGCGRGEWIELLSEHGYQITGLDLNEQNIANCKAKKLDAQLANGIDWLRKVPTQSLALISSMHVVEHLTIPHLNSLLVESLRTLKPGGILLLETPNPENLITAANRFYTDPSHRHPIPPDLLEFLLKYKGFEAVEIHRLHPPEFQFSDGNEVTTTLNQILFGPQDYAVIAQKP